MNRELGIEITVMLLGRTLPGITNALATGIVRDEIRIGRLFGIDLKLDYSWVFIFALMIIELSSYFMTAHSDWSTGSAIMVAVASACLFFASVVVHEYGHALVAKRFKLNVREIRLFLFGGVSNIEREPPSPRAELLIAIIGPLVSFAIGITMIGVATLAMSSRPSLARVDDLGGAIRGIGPLTTILLWLGPLNILIGVFNLIPGFPLDGGRVLRAVLWKLTGNLHLATRWATTAGQLVGWSFVAMGVAMVFGAKIPFFGEGYGSGIWLAFIGWFLRSAAVNSYRGLIIEELLDGLSVANLMRRRGDVLPSNMTVANAANSFMSTNEHAFPVGDSDLVSRTGERTGGFVGILCTGDLRRVPRNEWSTTPISVVMTPRDRLVTVTPREPAINALKKLSEQNVEQLPVLADADDEQEPGALVGMLERRSLMRRLEMNLDVRTPMSKPTRPRPA